MGQGLQIWDAAGTLIFDSATLTTRIVATINTGTSDGSASFPVTNNNFVAWPTQYSGGVPPSISIPSYGTVTWTFGATPAGLRSSAKILILGY